MAIEVQVVSDSKLAQADMDKLRASVDNIGKSVNKATEGMKSWALGLGTAIASTATLGMLVKMSDTMTGLSSKLKMATSNQTEFNKALSVTKTIALDTRSELDDVVTLYGKIALASKSLGATQDQIATVTSNVARSIALSGAGVAETQAAVLQLGQALASGRLQGDEMRSVLENAPVLAQQIAEGMGKTVAEMRMLGAEGKVTSKDVFDALLKQTTKINSMAGNIGVTFAAAFTNVKNASVILFDAISHYDTVAASGNSTSKTLAERINDMALATARLGEDFGQTILSMRVAIWKLVLNTKSGFDSIGETVSNAFGKGQNRIVDNAKDAMSSVAHVFSTFNFAGFNIKFDIKKIHLEDFITKLEPMRQLVLGWCHDVERAFFWVYDRVIGHSWIPDLVEGVMLWMGKLLDSPLAAAREFTQSVSRMFENLADKVVNLPFIDSLIKKLKKAKDDLESTALMHNLRQSLGMQDVVGGSFANRQSPTGYSLYDTKAKVGRGAHRSEEDRPFLHDITGAFASENQIPFIATLTTSLSAGLIAAFASGSVIKGIAVAIGTGIATSLAGAEDRLLPIGILIGGGIIATLTGGGVTKAIVAIMSTAFGLLSANLVSDQEISMTTGNVASAFLKIIHQGIELLFGSGIFGEKGFGGTLALMAKLSLLFEKGREVVGNAVKSIALAPMTIVDDVTDRTRLWQANRALRSNLAEQQVTATKAQTNLTNAMAATRSAYAKLAQSQLKNGHNVGTQGAKFFRQSDQAGRVQLVEAYGKTAKEAARQIDRAERVLAMAQKQQNAVPSAIANLKDAGKALAENRDTIAKRIDESTARFKAGTIAIGAGIGAAFGTMGGFNIGQKIAAQMGDAYSSWAKIGVEIGASLLGQGIGAAIGTAAGALIANAVILGAGVLFSIPALIIGSIAAAIWAGMHWDEVKVWWEAVWPVAKQIFSDAWDRLTNIFEKAWNDLRSTLYDILPQKGKDAVDIAKNGGSFTDIRSSFEKGTIGGNSTLTGFSPHVDPFIAGQLKAAQNAVSPDERANNLAAVEDIKKAANFAWDATKDIFTKLGIGAKAALSSTLDFFVSSAGAAESDISRSINTNIIEPIHRATNADITVSKQDSVVDKLAAAIKSVEGTREGVTSFKGAAGVMQIIPDTFNAVVKQHNLINKDFNIAADRIEVAKVYIADLWDQYKDPKKVFAVYNGGPSAVNSNGTFNDRKTIKDGKVLDTSTNFAERAMEVYEGIKPSTSKLDAVKVEASDVAASIKEGFTSFKEDPMKFVTGLIDKALIASGIKKPIIEGPMPQTKDEELKGKLLSTKLSGLSYADDTLAELNKALDSIGSRTLTLEDYNGASKAGLEAIVTNFDDLAKFEQALPNLTGFYRDKTVELMSDLANKIKADVEKAIKQDPTKIDTSKASADAIKAGTDYATKLQEDVATGLKGLLKGNYKGGIKAFLKNFADTFTDSVIGALSKGLTSTFFKTTGLDTLMAKAVENVGFLGEKGGQIAGNNARGYSTDISGNAAGNNAWGDFKQWMTDIANGGTPTALGIKSAIIDANSLQANMTPNPDVGAIDYRAKFSGLNESIDKASADIGKLSTDATKALADPIESLKSANTDVNEGLSATILTFGDNVKAALGEAGDGFLAFFESAGTGIKMLGQGIIRTIAQAFANSGGGKIDWFGLALTAVGAVAGASGGFSDVNVGAGVDIANTSNTFSTPVADSFSNIQTLELPASTVIDTSNLSIDFQKYAIGGKVSGPGTGTSDSIPAMLSNGEFVVRARQATKFAPLLDAINEGTIAKFAEGGFVGASLPALDNGSLSIKSQSDNSKQIFNINVTGDISRQTRKEIVQMMPDIAIGVNMHNKERGRR